MTKNVSLRVVFQMDPLRSLHAERDTTLLLIKEALKRGYKTYYYEPSQMFFEEGKVKATLFSLWSEPLSAWGLEEEEKGVYDLETMDVLWVRQDPPFDMGYLTTTYLLDYLKHPVIINSPAGIRAGPEKLLPLCFYPWMPATLITHSLTQAKVFCNHHGTVIVKPLYEYSGRFIYKVDSAEALEEIFFKELQRCPRLPLIIQRFLPAIHQGDKRVFMINGKVIGCFRRTPAPDNYLSNFAQGGSASAEQLTPKDHKLCNELAPLLKEMGLFFVGLDVIDGHLIEINVTSPTGVPTYNQLYGVKMEEMLWDSLVEVYLT